MNNDPTLRPAPLDDDSTRGLKRDPFDNSLTMPKSVLDSAPKNEIRQGSYTQVSDANTEPLLNAQQAAVRYGTKGLEQVSMVELPSNGGLIDAGTDQEVFEQEAKLEAGNKLLVFRGQNEGGAYYAIGSREAFNRHKDNPDQAEPDIQYVMPGKTLQIGRGQGGWLPREAQERESSTKRPRISSRQAIFTNTGDGLWLENVGHNPISFPQESKVDYHYVGRRHKSDWKSLGQMLRESAEGDGPLSSSEVNSGMHVSFQPEKLGQEAIKATQSNIETDNTDDMQRRKLVAQRLVDNMTAGLVATLGDKELPQENPTSDQPKSGNNATTETSAYRRP